MAPRQWLLQTFQAVSFHGAGSCPAYRAVAGTASLSTRRAGLVPTRNIRYSFGDYGDHFIIRRPRQRSSSSLPIVTKLPFRTSMPFAIRSARQDRMSSTCAAWSCPFDLVPGRHPKEGRAGHSALPCLVVGRFEQAAVEGDVDSP